VPGSHTTAPTKNIQKRYFCPTINFRTSSFRRKLAALIGALLIGLMSVAPAFAASNSVTDVRLAPGATLCITPATPNVNAISYANANGTANAGGATFVVFNGSPNASNPIYIAPSPASFNATFTTSLPMGATFPGKFKLCATNPSTTNNTRITMSITTN
jgi:hypothetical protein